MSTALATPEPQVLAEWGDRKLLNAIQQGHVAAGAHMNNYQQAAAVTGLLLMEQRRRLPSRGFSPWLEQYFDGSRRTAYVYIEMAEAAGLSVQPTAQIEAPEEVNPEPSEDEVLDGEVVDDDDLEPEPESEPQPEPEASEPPDPTEPLRDELIDWFAQGRVVRRMLDDDGINPIHFADRESLARDAALMVSTAERLKGVLSS